MGTDTVLLVLVPLIIIGTAVAAVPVTFLVISGSRGIPEGRIRTLFRHMLVTPIAIVLGVGTACAASTLVDDGRWQCLVCAKEEDRQSFAGIAYQRSACPPSEFETWFRRELGRDHDHHWTPVGCHLRGNMIACHEAGPAWTLFESLPKLSDQKLAISLASRVLEARHSKRKAMVIAASDEPFHSIAYGDATSVQDFDAAYLAWLDRHPEWK